MKKILLFAALFSFGQLFAQKTKTNTAKIDFTQAPSVPVAGMKSLGIQVFTADLPFNKDTLRLYLGNMDIMKSNAERFSKMNFQALEDITVLGGEGDLTFEMAFGDAMVVNKEIKTTSCPVAKEGCTQYYYLVNYLLPTVVRARKGEQVVGAWELPSNMDLQFGNEQVEKHTKTDGGSKTSVQVVSYTSKEALIRAFAASGEANMARKGIVKQMGQMAELIYDNAFYEPQTLKLDIYYGNGKATDYTETETAAEKAVTALESKNYNELESLIPIWKNWLTKYDANDKKAAVNHKVAQGLHENLSIAYTFTQNYDEARKHLDEALVFANTGMVSTNEVNRLEEFHQFINKQEMAQKYNGSLNTTLLVTAPDIKAMMGKKKLNENFDFLFAEDRYQSVMKSLGEDVAAAQEANPLDALMGNSGSASGDNGGEITLEGRVENNMLVLSGLIDGNMRGKELHESICNYPEIETIRARNIGLTGLPQCFGSLINLEKVFLNDNDFGTLPDVFGKLNKLEVLDLSDCGLTTLPPSVFTLTQLKKINVSGNKLSAEEIAKLQAALPNTKFL